MALEDQKSQRQILFISSLCSQNAFDQGLSGSWGRGEVRERIKAAAVRVLTDSLAYFSWKESWNALGKSKWPIYYQDSAQGTTLTVPYSSNKK